MKFRSFLVYVMAAVAAVAFAQTPDANAPAPKATISGVIRDLTTGQPVAEADVSGLQPPAMPVRTKTDAQGRYSLHDVEPGRVQVSARAPFIQGAGFPMATNKYVTVGAGQTLEGVDLLLRQNAKISGTLLDQNDEPVPDLTVLLVAREYQMGELHHVIAGVGKSDDQGHYALERVTPGHAFLVVALKREASKPMDAISDAPTDPALRRPAVVPTYYPGVDRIEGAQTLTLQPGEGRENVDLRIQRSPAYCLEGTLQAAGGAGPMSFEYKEAEPHDGWANSSGLFMTGTHGKTGADGKVRICDLHPGEYRFTVSQRPDGPPQGNGPPPYFGSALATVTDRDAGIVVTVPAKVRVPGEVVWDDTPLDSFVAPQRWTLELRPVTRAPWAGETSFLTLAGMGPFVAESLFTDDYAVLLRTVPDGTYLKDITYGNKSVLHRAFHPGSTVGEGTLRVVLAHDGGRVSAKVADKDGKAVADSFVMLLPAEVRSEADLADVVVSGQTDQNGAWTSAMIAPGKYYALASRTPFDASPETVGRLWGARGKAEEVEVGKGATVEVGVAPLE